MQVNGARERGRPKKRWIDSVRNDLNVKRFTVEEFEDKKAWEDSSIHRPQISWEKMMEK